MLKGGLNHESREINEVFHDSRKFFEGFHVSRKISAGWSGYRALGTICNYRRVQSSPGGDPGGEAPRNLRNLAFSGYQIEAKNRSHDTR